MVASGPGRHISRPRSKGRGGTRDAIVQAAAEVLGEKGFNAASIDEVAERAGVTKATVYYHFSSKEDLYAAVRIDLLDASTIEGRESITGMASAPTALARLVDLTIELTLDRSRRYMFFHEIIPINPDVRRAIGAAQRQYAQLLEDVLEKGQRQGVFIPGPPRVVIAILLGTIARTLSWYDEEGEVKPAEFSQLLRTMALGGILQSQGDDATGLSGGLAQLDGTNPAAGVPPQE